MGNVLDSYGDGGDKPIHKRHNTKPFAGMDVESNPIYHPINGESYSDYELFSLYARTPPSRRSFMSLSRTSGVNHKVISRLSEQYHWPQRLAAFDNDTLMLNPASSDHMDGEAATAQQLAAAQMLIELGLSALETKSPGLISVDKAVRLAEKGIDIQRKALGQADIRIEFSTEDFAKVNGIIEDIIALEVEDAEVVEEGE